MAVILNQIEIKNFKSIKHIKTDCKRINVFIGKPNVGKSNILEAIGLLGTSYSASEEKFLSGFLRYEEISNLFYDENLLNRIEIKTDKGQAILRYHSNNINHADLIIGKGSWIKQVLSIESSISDIQRKFQEVTDKIAQAGEKQISPYYIAINPNGKTATSEILSDNYSPIKKYHFKPTRVNNKFPYFLLPPNGNNLFTIVDHNAELRKEIIELFTEYGLQFVANKKESKFVIQKNVDGYINQYPYSSIADTFQRLIFYYAVIDSNKDSVLILEEPEVHSFPPYTKDLSERIIASEENQFFITTHSPYLLQNMISSLDISQLNVFITYYENYETKIKQLSKEELRKAADFDIDLFYNLDQFVTNYE